MYICVYSPAEAAAWRQVDHTSKEHFRLPIIIIIVVFLFLLYYHYYLYIIIIELLIFYYNYYFIIIIISKNMYISIFSSSLTLFAVGKAPSTAIFYISSWSRTESTYTDHLLASYTSPG
jgi:hypothetical protein